MKRIYTMMAVLLAGFATLSAQEVQEIPGTLDVNKAVLDTKTSDGSHNGIVIVNGKKEVR